MGKQRGDPVSAEDVLRHLEGLNMRRKAAFRLSGPMVPEDAVEIARERQAKLEACVEDTAACAKCKGKIRAQCVDSAPGALSSDLEIKVALHCRDATCAWQGTQWRPWRRVAPEVL
ncbi:MAG: hypothetical protein ACRDZ4_11540 [Egibacteraceae bacterium]